MRALKEDIKRYIWRPESPKLILYSVVSVLFSPGLQATALYRFGNYAAGLRLSFVRYPLLAIYHVLNYLIAWFFWGIQIAHTAKIGPGVRFWHFGSIIIGINAVIGEKATIHHDVTIGSKGQKCPTIGNNVTIYPGAKIFGDIKIGDNAVIGANAVVDKDVPENTIVAAPRFIVLGVKKEHRE